MAGTNQFKAFATGGSAYTLTAADYAALTDFLANGFPSGIVDGAKFNTVLRQACMVAASLGKIVSDANLNALDDGNVSTLAANIYAALRASLVGQSTTITAGNGLTGGGSLNGPVTLHVGTPETCSGATPNAASADSHTHAFAAASADVAGAIRIATDAETYAGQSRIAAITPSTLNLFFVALFGKRTFSENDYIRIPDVPGGLILQWCKIVDNGNTNSFPIAFSTAVLGMVASVIYDGYHDDAPAVFPVSTTQFRARTGTTSTLSDSIYVFSWGF